MANGKKLETGQQTAGTLPTAPPIAPKPLVNPKTGETIAPNIDPFTGKKVADADVARQLHRSAAALKFFQQQPGDIATTPKSVITTDRARKKTSENQQKLADLTEQQAAGAVTPGGPAPSATIEAPKAQEQAELGVFEKQLQDLDIQVQSTFDENIAQLDAFQKTLDQQNQAQIQSIKDQFAVRRTQLADLNKRTLRGQQLLGVRSGRQRFAPEIQTGILSAEESAGIQRISELDSQEKALISQAEAANTAEQFSILNARMNQLSQLQDKKRQAILDLSALSKERNQQIAQDAAQAREEMKFQNEILEFRQGQEERASLLTAPLLLGTDAEGNLVLPSPDEILSASEQSGIDPRLLERDVTAEFERLVSLSQEDQANQLNLSIKRAQEGRARAQEQREAALFPFDLLKAQKDAQATQGVFTNFEGNADAGVIQNTLGNLGVKLTEGSRKFLVSEVERLVGEGNFLGAKELLISSALEAAPTAQQEKSFGRSEALAALDNITTLFGELEAKGGDTGFFKGSMESIANKIGKTTDPELAFVQNQIRQAIVDYRKAVSGAAFTESEQKEYEQLFPSIKKVKNFNEATIDSLKSTFNRNEEVFLKQILGETNFNALQQVKDPQSAFSDFADFESRATDQQLDQFDTLDNNPEFEDFSPNELIELINQQSGFKLGLGTPQKGPLTLEDAPDLSGVKNEDPLTLNIGKGIVTGITGSRLSRRGLDFVLLGGGKWQRGAKVPAPFTGTVVQARDKGDGFGKRVVIELPGGELVGLAHLQSINPGIIEGDTISEGQNIGEQGNTGSVIGSQGQDLTPAQIADGAGTHLDIEIKRPDGTFFSPREVAQLLSKFA